MIESKNYLEDIKSELEALLAARRESLNPNERLVQNFFEKNPSCLLPVIENLPASDSIYGRVIISQPRFKSYGGDKQPDFLIVTSNSLHLYFNFIEIEDPGKKIFRNAKLSLTANFSQAYGQLKTWSSQNNREVEKYCGHLLETVFHTNSEFGMIKKHHYTYTLVYGFSQEVLERGADHNSFLAGYFADKQLNHCTYSRLLSKLTFIIKLITVKIADSKFIAIGMTPFDNYGYEDWYDYRKIFGKIDLINQSPYLSDEDKGRLVAKIDARDPMSEEEFNLDFFGSEPVKGLRIRSAFDDPD